MLALTEELAMEECGGESKMRQAIANGDINIPEAAAVPGSASKLPFVIVADDAFPLMPNIMKPYQGSKLSTECLVFYYRLSRARFRVFGPTLLTSVPCYQCRKGTTNKLFVLSHYSNMHCLIVSSKPNSHYIF
ncbi:hypothetical protein TNCV_4574891 [Trichonephila clavipes]|nr:hypothetical protein TNCV_4574891 [Trichonephila clavipes]